MATNASTDYAIDGTAGVKLFTAHSGTATNPFAIGHTVRVPGNRIALRVRCDFDASGVLSTASASVTVSTSTDGLIHAQAAGTDHILLAQDGTATAGTFVWVINKSVGATEV